MGVPGLNMSTSGTEINYMPVKLLLIVIQNSFCISNTPISGMELNISYL